MACEQCKTEVEDRTILFGKSAKVTVLSCECEAMRLMLKYQNVDTARDTAKAQGWRRE